MSYLNAFITQFDNLTTELNELYPMDKNIAMTKNYMYLLKNMIKIHRV